MSLLCVLLAACSPAAPGPSARTPGEAPPKLAASAPLPPKVDEAPAPAPEELPPITPASGIVLLRPDAMILDAPREGATTSELVPYGASIHLHPLQAAYPARVVGRAGPYFAIGSGEAPKDTCYPDRGTLFRGLSITVFVHEDDVYPVLTRPIEVKFGAGFVRLDPGVALGAPSRFGGDAHFREAAATPLAISLLVPDDAVGSSYVADRPPPAPSPGDPDALLAGTCEEGGYCYISFGGEAAARISGPGNVPVRRVDKNVDRTIVSIRGACMDVRAVVNERALHPLPKTLHTFGFGTACGGFTRDDWSVRADTKAYWPDGRVAGVVSTEKIWMHDSLSDHSGTRRCFKRHPTLKESCGNEKKYLRVCFDDADVARIGGR